MRTTKNNSYTVPQRIRDVKRPDGTTVKLVNGKYYVYASKRTIGKDGKSRRTYPTDIGSIDPIRLRFKPNKSFPAIDDKVKIIEYGPYAMVVSNTEDILAFLEKSFPGQGLALYTLAVVMFVDGFGSINHAFQNYWQSYLPLRFPESRETFSDFKLFSDFQNQLKEGMASFQNGLARRASGSIIVRWHVIRRRKDDADLQMILGDRSSDGRILFAYDSHRNPLFARFVVPDDLAGFLSGLFGLCGSSDERPDKIIITENSLYRKNLSEQLNKNGIPFIISLPMQFAKPFDKEYVEAYKSGDIVWKEEEKDGIFRYSFRTKTPDNNSFFNEVYDMVFNYDGMLGRLIGPQGCLVLETNIKGDASTIYQEFLDKRELEYNDEMFEAIDHIICTEKQKSVIQVLLLATFLVSQKMGCLDLPNYNTPAEALNLRDVMEIVRSAKCHMVRGKWVTTGVTRQVSTLFSLFKVDKDEVLLIPVQKSWDGKKGVMDTPPSFDMFRDDGLSDTL